MINFQRILSKPESREDKLRRMWTKIYEAAQRRKHGEISLEDDSLDQIL